MRQAQAYLSAAGGKSNTIGAHGVTVDKDLLASAQAFAKTTTLYVFSISVSISVTVCDCCSGRRPSSSSSSSSDSSSSSSSSSSAASKGKPDMLLNTGMLLTCVVQYSALQLQSYR